MSSAGVGKSGGRGNIGRPRTNKVSIYPSRLRQAKGVIRFASTVAGRQSATISLRIEGGRPTDRPVASYLISALPILLVGEDLLTP